MLLLYSMKAILTALLIYIGYKLVFGFIIPVAKTASHIKKNMKDMHKPQEPNYNSNNYTSAESPKPSKKDYIEFEEIKNE